MRFVSVCVWVSCLCLSSRTLCGGKFTVSWEHQAETLWIYLCSVLAGHCAEVNSQCSGKGHCAFTSAQCPSRTLCGGKFTVFWKRTLWIYLHTVSFVRNRGWKLKHKQRRTGYTVSTILFFPFFPMILFIDNKSFLHISETRNPKNVCENSRVLVGNFLCTMCWNGCGGNTVQNTKNSSQVTDFFLRTLFCF